MTTSNQHSTHRTAEFPDTCVTCTQEWYGVEDVAIVEVSYDVETESYRVLKFTKREGEK